MSRGNYIGGSTIVGRTGWSTYDPAEIRDSEGTKSKSKSLKERKPKGKRKKPKPIKGISRLQLINLILDKHLTGLTELKLPKSTSQDLKSEISMHETPLAWAKKQNSFQKIKEKKLKKISLQKGGDQTEVIEKSGAVKIGEKIERNKRKPDYAARVLKVKENLEKRTKNVQILRTKEKSKRGTETIKNKDIKQNPDLADNSIEHQETALKGYLLSWFEYKKFLTGKQITKKQKQVLNNRRTLLRNRVFFLLPSPPNPEVPPEDVLDLDETKQRILKIWKSALDETQLGYWNLLTAAERQTYLFHKTNFAKFCKKVEKANLRKKRKLSQEKRSNKSKTGSSDLKKTDVMKVINKRISERRDDSWDYNKTDWDLT